MQRIYRQGDVALIAVQQIPDGAIEQPPTDSGKVILAYGEVTGHHHRIERVTRDHPSVRLWQAGVERWLQVMTRCELVHEEHSAIVLEPGIYSLPVQVEHTSEREVRRVAD